MRDSQKVYIKGSVERGDEVIKLLEDLGGRNSNSINGKNVNAYYFINPNGIIVNNYLSGSEVFSYVKEFYKEIQLSRWKPEYGDQYFYIDPMGTVQQESWYYTYINKSNYEFGNCFRTYKEAELARDKIKELLNNRA